MKKRSLVAAIAMLIVSAIVLTSSTYAWFASNSAANVETISANVANNDGSLQIMATEAAVTGSTVSSAAAENTKPSANAASRHRILFIITGFTPPDGDVCFSSKMNILA